MAAIPSKVLERITKNYNNIKKIIIAASHKDINEADTVFIVSDILSEILGYDKYDNITREYVIKGTYCDLAIKTNENIEFLIEVKAIGIKLNEKHIKQAVDYGANQGIDYVILTNGIYWSVYKLSFDKPITTKLLYSFNFLELNIRKQEDQEKLFILCKEGLQKNAIDKYSEYKKIVNRFFISTIIQSDDVLNLIRRQLKKILPKFKIENPEIKSILFNSVLKREVLESEEAKESVIEYKKQLKKLEKK